MITTPTMGHTKSPWAYERRLSGSENCKGFWLRSKNGWNIADIFPIDEDGKEGEANAAFIVQACNAHDELVEALSELLNDAIGGYMIQTNGNGDPEKVAVFKKSEAAIAKATAA